MIKDLDYPTATAAVSSVHAKNEVYEKIQRNHDIGKERCAGSSPGWRALWPQKQASISFRCADPLIKWGRYIWLTGKIRSRSLCASCKAQVKTKEYGCGNGNSSLLHRCALAPLDIFSRPLIRRNLFSPSKLHLKLTKMILAITLRHPHNIDLSPASQYVKYCL